MGNIKAGQEGICDYCAKQSDCKFHKHLTEMNQCMTRCRAFEDFDERKRPKKEPLYEPADEEGYDEDWSN